MHKQTIEDLRPLKLHRSVSDIAGIGIHTRHVQLLKLLLPSLSAVLLCFILIWPSFVSEQNNLIADNTPNLKNIEAMTIVNPSFQSTDKKNNPFNLSANKAFEKTKSIVILDEPKGDIFINNRDMLAFSATLGEYNRSEQKVTFNGDVTIISDRGYTINTEKITVDLQTRDINSISEVNIKSDSGTITGNGFSIKNNGNNIIIKGKAKMVLENGKLAF